MNVYRPITSNESLLITAMLRDTEHALLLDCLANLLAKDMADGGMGSARLIQSGSENKNREYGQQIGSCSFVDSDGIIVLVALNTDKEGQLFELDIWKTDFSKLNSMPNIKQLFDININMRG